MSLVDNCNLIVQTCGASPTEYCGKPEGAGRRMEIPDQVLERYENGNQIDYTCINPYKGPGGKATCKNGEWHMPVECNGKSMVLYYHDNTVQ